MIIPTRLQQRFNNISPYLERTSDTVGATVSYFCSIHEFAYIYRIKTLDSLAEKIETGRFERWSDIDDLFACTIIIPNLSYEEIVIKFLKTTFCEVDLKRRGTTLKAPDVFRFDSTRFIGKLTPREGDEKNPIFNIKFEVQIRTAFEHAWIAATHPLTYKSEKIDWKRYRLTAQLKAVVEQMDMLVMGFDQASEFISENAWPEIESKQTIIKQIKNAFLENQLREELEPKDWTRFSDNVYSMLTATNEAQEMRPIKRYKYVEAGLKIIINELDEFEPSQVPISISLVQLIFGILSKHKFLEPPLSGYVPIITNELLTFYPSVEIFEKSFLFEN
jgi:ppGpp synthetase/RelA/SpoT-type nucleotidyltranferase